MPHGCDKGTYVECTAYDAHYLRCSVLAWIQGLASLFFLAWTIIGLLALVSTMSRIHHFWQFTLAFSIIGGVVVFLAQLIAIIQYHQKTAYIQVRSYAPPLLLLLTVISTSSHPIITSGCTWAG